VRKSAAVVWATVLLVAACGGDGDSAPPTREGAVSVVAAGDIARCGSEEDEATAALVEKEPDATVLALGDNAYPEGLNDDYEQCFGPGWGRFKERIRPTPGNHEYAYFHKDAAAYFDYFGDAAGPYGTGYYSFDLGSWHLVALNSNCDAEALHGCGPDSPQVEWLRDDLREHAAMCTLAYWHHPRFSAGPMHFSDDSVQTFWDVLAEADADVVLSGHEHNYQRFAPQTPSGEPDPDRGIREFVVGTGGGQLYPIGDELPTTEVQQSDAHGVLFLTLYEGGYDWRFEPVAGQEFTDRGSGRCH
jgi:hypothetical protein